jgi:hypothetical protein
MDEAGTEACSMKGTFAEAMTQPLTSAKTPSST